MWENLEPEIIVGLYEAEYFSLLSTYESYNDQSLLIKGWSVSVGLVAILSCYRFKPGEEPPAVAVWFAAFATLPFFAMDALWKALQGGYEFRLKQIECVLREKVEPAILQCEGYKAPLQSIEVWENSMGKTQVLLDSIKAMINTTVFLPHVFILVGGIVLALFFPPNRIRKR